MTTKKTIAVLNEKNMFIGTKEVTASKVKDTDVVVDPEIDLPQDGTYRWDKKQQAFFPLGHGYDKPVAAPTSQMHVLYLAIKALKDSGTDLGDVVDAWCRWYEQEMRDREEEEAQRQRVKSEFFRTEGA